MKRIICTVSNDLSNDQRMIRICTSLAGAGYEVLLLGRELKDSKPLKHCAFAQKRLNLRFNKGKLFYLELNFRLFFLLLLSKFDLVYAVDLDTLLPGRAVSLLRKKTCVFDAHEYFTEVPELTDRPFSKRIWELAASLAIPGVKHAITVCGSLSQVFEARYGVRFEVIRNVPFSLKSNSKSEKPDQPFVLIYQGALNEGRGLEASILAMKQLSGAELWICGEGDLSDELRLLAKQNDLDDSVKFLGKLAPDELVLVTQQAHLGLNLLENKGLNYYYSLANKAFDYMQAGIPSLNMAFPEYVLIHQEFDVFVLLEELEPGKIAEAVTRLRSDKASYERLADNARKAALVLNWEKESVKLKAFFKAI